MKHGLIADAGYLSWIEANTAPLLARDLGALEVLIRRSVEIKSAVVAGDEREAGARAMLNAGHTVAHALEVISGYTLLHGQAVALGLIAECAMAEAAGLLPAGTSARIRGVLGSLGLPVRVPFRSNSERVRQAMLRDKKNVAGEIRFAIPIAPGEMGPRHDRWTVGLDDEKIDEGLGSIL